MTELYVITGPAGSGKTTLGLALAAACNGASLDLDVVTDELVRRHLAAHPDRSEPEALTELRSQRYALLTGLARKLIAGGETPALVLIAPFTAEIASADSWRAWLSSLGQPAERAHLVWLRLTAEERLRRLAVRGESRDEALVATGSVPVPTLPGAPALVVDAVQPVDEQVSTVLQRFGNA